MALDFPNSPSVNDSFSAGGKTWIYNGTKWVLLSVSLNQTVADGAITTSKIADSAITASKIADGTVVAAEIASSAITTVKINDAAVTTAKINDAAVTTAKILDSNVTTAKINDAAVTTAKVNDAAVTTAKINDAAVTQAKLGTTLSAVTVTTAANRDTAVASPFTGQLVFLTDTKKIQVWDGTSWLNITLAPPETPTSLSATALSTTSVSVAFTAGGANGSPITNYKYATSADNVTYSAYSALDPADTTSPITISGLTLGTTYYIKLKAVNDMGDSVASAAVTVTTLTPLSISGGQETVTVGGYKYVVFTSSGTLTASGAAGTVDIMTVGGGGGGGTNVGGGGGGGELDTFAPFTISSNLTVTVGAAGTSGFYTVISTSGGTSSVSDGVTTFQTALGGGRGGGDAAGGSYNGNTGGSGGGARTTGTGGGASGSNTNAGGNGGGIFNNENQPAGGGGGYGGAGGAGSSGVSGNGGASVNLSTLDANLTVTNFPTALGSSKIYVAGGGGGGFYNSGTAGTGANGAGNGASGTGGSAGGATSYGCGGGGANGAGNGGAGFAGLVIIRQAV